MDVAPKSARGALLKASAFYFACVFAVGLVCGPIRVIWIEPFLGTTLSVALETPILITAMWLAAGMAPRWAGLEAKWPSYLAVGVIALLLQQAADLSVGFGLRGMTLQSQLSYFTTPPGWIYAAALVAFSVMPLIRQARTPPANTAESSNSA